MTIEPKEKRPDVLIEQWLPIETISAESMRERGASSALPPLYFLHVWWARRPLLVSRAAILASVLPAWNANWPAHLKERYPDEQSYQAWFLKLCGIFGDPVAGRKLMLWANSRGKKLEASPFTHRRAFTVNPSSDMLAEMRTLLQYAWGHRDLSVLDPFAGGGSIPFEALRYGFETHANELNPVATVILKATLEYPLRFGPELVEDIRKYGNMLAARVRERLEPFFPCPPDESIHAYIWARTVRCPYTGKPIPLSPNWWLRKGADPVAVQPIFSPSADEARFRIVEGREACAAIDPERGTVRRGDAVSPWAGGQPVDGDYIKAEAQAGRMGQQLYALAIKKRGGVSFRSPTAVDFTAVRAAEEELARRLPEWDSQGLIPNEQIDDISNYDRGHRLYGIKQWREMFMPRHLLVMGTLIDVVNELANSVDLVLEEENWAKAVKSTLAIVIDKAADYNTCQASWDTTRQKVAHAFTQHGYSIKWTFSEFDGARALTPWIVEQVADAYEGIADLVPRDSGFLKSVISSLCITNGSAIRLQSRADRSIEHICTDPPYEANVMYAELSDFFYVWMKRTLGDVHPDLFRDELTNKDDEAVANEARFAGMGRKKKALALDDYRRKMLAAFREMHRVLKDEGVLTVMFTHKQVAAWDSLASSLISAGFVVKASWPVHTESEKSIHQAKKNAAKSTILLACRKREPSDGQVWWEDIKDEVRQVARKKARAFEGQGIRGVDLYIATFGPTLEVISRHWPVLTAETDERTGKPKELRPEIALDLAREEVVALRRQGLLLGRTLQFDPHTDWYLLAWDTFGAEEFPADEALKLALALGLDLDREVIGAKRLVAKKGATVVLRQPKDRRNRDMVNPDLDRFACWIDALHTAMLVYEEDGGAACRAFLGRAMLANDDTFKACLQAAMAAIPRTRQKGRFVRPEAETLEAMRLAFFDDIPAPPDPEPDEQYEQLVIAGTAKTAGGELDGEDDVEDEEGEAG